MAEINPIQYTSRTFNSILTDIDSDSSLVDKPNWWKRIWAGIGDVISMWLNAQANDLFLRTAFTRQAVTDLCALIDYALSPQTTSSTDLIFYLDAGTVTFPISFATNYLKASYPGSAVVPSKPFEARSSYSQTTQTSEAATHSSGTWTVTRGYTTGEKVRLTTTVTLPTPLAISTDYYAIRVNPTSIRLATSLANAYAGSYISSTGGSGVHTIWLWCFQKTCYQQESTLSPVVIGTSDGTTAWQAFDLPDLLILKDTIVITINSITWTMVTTFVDSTSSSTHYRVLYREDGSAYIKFGNGTYGQIPGAFPIYASFSKGGGIDSNIYSIGGVNSYSGGGSGILGVSNPSTVTGGADAESLQSAKELAPLLLKTRDRFITQGDGESLVLGYGGVSHTLCNKNYAGILSAQFVIIPNGGGTSSSGFKTSLQNYLIDRSILGSVTISVIDADYVATAVTGQIQMVLGYSWTSVQAFATLAIRLRLTEVGHEFLYIYNESGIDALITAINNKWATSFSSSDSGQIQRLIENLEPAAIGVSLQESDLIGYVSSYVYGVDYITFSVPTFPVTITTLQITKEGTITLSQF